MLRLFFPRASFSPLFTSSSPFLLPRYPSPSILFSFLIVCCSCHPSSPSHIFPSSHLIPSPTLPPFRAVTSMDVEIKASVMLFVNSMLSGVDDPGSTPHIFLYSFQSISIRPPPPPPLLLFFPLTPPSPSLPSRSFFPRSLSP